MSLVPNIDASLFRLSDEQKRARSSIETNYKLPLLQLEKEFDTFERIDRNDKEHKEALNELFLPYLLKECDKLDLELFSSMSRFDRRSNSFVVGCFENQPFDFVLLSYKWRYKDGIKWKTRAGTTPNSTPLVRIYTDNEPIYVIEGHRDSLTAVLLGLDFIMIPYAGFKLKEPEGLQKEVAGRDVVFLVEDGAAYKCMYEVAEQLKETANRIQLIELSDSDRKMDLSDFAQQYNHIQEVKDVLQTRR